MPFEFKELEMPGIIAVRPRMFEDDRGGFMEVYKHSEFARAGIHERFVQDNYSRSGKNVLRGLHYQKDTAAQGKLVWCVRGRIFDVAVDIRKGSPTYGRWTGLELSESNRTMLYIPPAFAHGFLVLGDFAEVVYKCTAEYSPENDRGIIWNDPDIAIEWPLKAPVLSEKDGRHPMLRDADNSFEYKK